MSRQPQDEAAFLAKLHTTLDQSVEALDPAIRARLATARQQAIGEIGRQPLPFRSITMLAMAASVVVLAVGVSLWWPSSHGTMPTADDLTLLTAGEDFELLEDLEFYRWLEATEHAT